MSGGHGLGKICALFSCPTAAAGADAKLKTRQMLNWTETSIKDGCGVHILELCSYLSIYTLFR